MMMMMMMMMMMTDIKYSQNVNQYTGYMVAAWAYFWKLYY